MMLVMTLISVLLVVSAVDTAIWKEKALPDSISAIVYIFKHGWLWTIWIWSVTFLLAPPLINALPYSWQALGFFTCASMVFCGAFPLFDTEHEKWHDILGVSAGILSQLCVLLICPWWLFAWVLYPLCLKYPQSKVFLLEGMCGISIYCCLL